MKGQKWFVWVVLALLVLLVVASGSVVAQAVRIECTGTEVRTDVLDPGVWTFPGGNIHVRGMVSQYQEESVNCPQLAGVNVAAMNANWDANYVGPMWGTARLETDYAGGGAWEGRWNGALSADGCTYRAVMHGVSGSVTGMKAFLNADCTSGSWTATILDPSAD